MFVGEKIMFRRSARKYSLYKKSGGSGFKLFIFGLLLGAVAILIFFHLRPAAEPIQLVVGTPAPPQEQSPEAYTWSESGNVGVLTPKGGALAQNPLTVQGTARLPDNEVYLRLKFLSKDKKGAAKEEVLAETATQAQAQGQGFYGSFSADLNFTPPSGTGIKDGVLEVFGLNVKDKTETDKLSMAVKFGR